MTIILGELRKLWTFKMALILLLLCILFYDIFMRFNVEYFRDGHPDAEMFEFSTELTRTYGNELDPEELSEFLSNKFEILIPEMEGYIQDHPIFAAAGINNYEEYQVFREKDYEMRTEAEEELMSWLINGIDNNWIDYKISSLNNIKEQYDSGADNGASTGALNWFVLERTNGYLMYIAILAVLCVLVFISPMLVIDRMRGIRLLQYSSKQGRSVLSKQLTAIILSVLVLVTMLIALASAIFNHIGVQTFFGTSINSFLAMSHHVVDMTFGQYILVQIGQIYLLSIGAALIAFILSRFSTNFVSLLLKLVPTFVALAMLCVVTFILIFNDESPLYALTNFVGIWPTTCGFILIIGLLAGVYVVHRERKIDVS